MMIKRLIERNGTNENSYILLRKVDISEHTYKVWLFGIAFFQNVLICQDALLHEFRNDTLRLIPVRNI